MKMAPSIKEKILKQLNDKHQNKQPKKPSKLQQLFQKKVETPTSQINKPPESNLKIIIQSKEDSFQIKNQRNLSSGKKQNKINLINLSNIERKRINSVYDKQKINNSSLLKQISYKNSKQVDSLKQFKVINTEKQINYAYKQQQDIPQQQISTNQIKDVLQNSQISMGFNKMDLLEQKNQKAIQENHAFQLQLLNLQSYSARRLNKR